MILAALLLIINDVSNQGRHPHQRKTHLSAHGTGTHGGNFGNDVRTSWHTHPLEMRKVLFAYWGGKDPIKMAKMHDTCYHTYFS